MKIHEPKCLGRAMSSQRRDTEATKKKFKLNANHGNRIKVVIDIAYKARNQEFTSSRRSGNE